jgi:hypothetical protein
MKITKILSFVAGVSLLATTLMPMKVSAASVSLSLSGATNTDGSFTATVYEDSGSARVTTAKIDLGFSGSVSNVSYDYSVGPFTNPTPSGARATQGYVTGSQPVARVTFKVANPGTVTTTAGGSYLKGTNDAGTEVITHSVSGGAATFTYNAPAPSNGDSTPAPTGTAPTTKNTTTNNTSNKTATTATTDGEVAGDETTAAETAKTEDDKKKDNTKKSDDKKDDSKDTSSSAWFWPVALVAVIAGYVAARTMRSRAAAKAAADTEAAAAAKAASDKPKNKKNKK